MDATARLQLPCIAPQQAQKHVTYNEAMRALDLLVQPAVKSASLAAPPAAPEEGDAYLVPGGAGGAWAGRDGQLALWRDGAWSFRTAADGWQLYVEDSAELMIRRDGTFAAFVSNGGSAVAQFGINTTPSLVDRLAVASEASLFTHAGAGHRLKLNKAGPAETASVLFQTGYSGRAEFGLAGDDDFHVKVSPDGASWIEGLTIAAAGGAVRLPQGQLGFPAVANPAADPTTLDDYREGNWTPVFTGSVSNPTVTYDTQIGQYVKIGQAVIACIDIRTDAASGGGGNLGLTLPFSVRAGHNPSGPVGRVLGWGANRPVYWIADEDTFTLTFHSAINDGTKLQCSDLTNAPNANRITMVIYYFTGG
ncbi:DUF2793 domain-containing protein [Devosia sp.]|uniref:DUF2793 domain-containing protein n=1 Tax=Devosia sp. TaxID=1871048 RepID=UPI002F005E39